MIEETNPHFYAIGIKGNAEGQITNTPRSSGLARMSLLIYTFILIFCFSKKKGIGIYYSLYIYIWIFCINFSIKNNEFYFLFYDFISYGFQF